MELLLIPCPVCGYTNYTNCDCRYIDYMARIIELENINVELETEIYRLRTSLAPITPIYFTISG